MAEQLSVRFDDGDYERLQAMALLTRRSMASLVVDAIRTEIDNADIELLAQQRAAELRDAAESLRQYSLKQVQ